MEAEPVALTVASPRAVVEYLSSPVNIAEVQEVETALGPTASAQHSTALGSYPTDQRQLVSSSAIEAQVTQSSYVDVPLVAVLRGLDWVLYAIETWLRGFWSWLQKQW
ncbi:hypothetical protein C8255_25210 [filamentous cyanobacterium CCP3]|nr:hypothetical protein C8255_25210 [filamentous cyanobacterium CCP3]